MSFDIFFMPCRYGDTAVESVDPCTGQTGNTLPNDPLTAAELNAVRRVLANANALDGENSGGGVARFDDSGYAEIYGQDLHKGCMVSLRGMTPDVLNFLFELLLAGNWIMIPTMPQTRAIAASLTAFQRIPHGFPEPTVCNSPEEIGLLINQGFDAWKAYRDRVVHEKCK